MKTWACPSELERLVSVDLHMLWKIMNWTCHLEHETWLQFASVDFGLWYAVAPKERDFAKWSSLGLETQFGLDALKTLPIHTSQLQEEQLGDSSRHTFCIWFWFWLCSYVCVPFSRCLQCGTHAGMLLEFVQEVLGRDEVVQEVAKTVVLIGRLQDWEDLQNIPEWMQLYAVH